MDQTLKPLYIPPQFSLYAEEHKIFDLYQRMLSQLIIHKPDEPLQFLIDFLKKDANSHAVIVIGPPSSGKKTLSRLLAKKTGSVLLNQSNLIETLPNNLKLEFKKDLESKNLKPQQWARVIKLRTEDYDCIRKGWILENFPETREQALALLAIGVLPKHTVVLQGQDSMLIERAAGKRVDAKTGEIYHTVYDWPSELSIQQRLVVPPNNTEEDIVNRLILYSRHIGGVLDSLKATSRGINVDQPKGDVFNQILEFVSRPARSVMPITPRIVLIGPPGSGKRTQAYALTRKYDIVNVSMSNLIKEAISAETPLGLAILPHYQKKTARIPDSLLIPLIKERLCKIDCVTRGWVLHGYPRTHDQAESLDQLGFCPNRVIFLDIPNDSLIERVTLRHLDPITGERYHLLFNPPASQEIRDRLVQKEVDGEDSLRNKIDEFYHHVTHLADYYDSIGIHVNADQDPNTVFELIESNIFSKSNYVGRTNCWYQKLDYQQLVRPTYVELARIIAAQMTRYSRSVIYVGGTPGIDRDSANLISMDSSAVMNGSSSLSSSCFFKQIHEKNTTLEVTKMLWNPKMDLIALAFANADVHLYRMSWQRVWSVTSNATQPTTVCSMAWRPDGKVLAISYSNKHLRLVAVEDAKKIYSCDCDEPIEWLYWLQESDEISQKFNANSFYEDTSHTQLPKPISYELITQLFDKANNGKEFADNLFIKETNKLTFLVCTWGTSISIFMHGYFLLIDTNLDSVPSYLNYKQLKSCFMSDNLSLVSALGLTDENLLVYSLLDTRILQDSHIQIKLVSNKFGVLLSMLDSLKSVIKEMEEQWEDILVEMDQKFQLYALEKFNNGGVAKIESSSLVNDFMLLYTFGSCSEQFKHFLLQELTEKGLRKLELSVESYYSNIQRLLNGNFQQLILSMFYHLNELHGMTKWSDKFKVFSITEEHVTKVLNNCATLILKSQELSFIIDQNIKEIKLFFKWLHSSMVHLNEETPSSDPVRFNQEMENSVLDFIQNTFKDAQTINMEKVGQYLKPENLKVLVMNENSWHSFLKFKFSSKENQYISLNKKEKSLIGCFDDFKKSLMECFENKAIGVKNPFSIVRQYNIHKFNTAQDSNDMIISYKCFQDYMITGLLMAKTNNECYILKHSINSEPDVKAYILNLSSHSVDFSQVYLQDVYIYGENSVTLLGSDGKSATPNTYLAQLDLQPTPIGILNDLIEVTSYSENGDKAKSGGANDAQQKNGKETNLLMIKAEKLSAHSIIKCLKKFKSHCFCVSSTRKLVALLSSNKHRVKIFEMEVEDDEDDDAENNELDEGGNENEYEEGNYKMSSQTSSLNRVGSEFSMANSVTSSNCAIAGSLANNASSSTLAMPSPSSSSVSSSQALMRGKRKKADADEDDEEETELSQVEFN